MSLSRPRARILRVLALVLAAATAAYAAGPVPHEFFEPDPADDLALEATALGGSMPAAMNTESGVVEAPRRARQRAPTERAYSGSTPTSLDATYQIDSDTRQPEVVNYDDPFIPSVTPFKRLFAYDAVSEGLELIVLDKRLTRLEIGGQVKPGDDSFYADMFVDVDKDVPVRIPSVGAGARILAAHVEPPGDFEILRDGAENWFLRMRERARVRFVMQIAVDRDTFGSPFANVPWSAFVANAPSVPESARETAREVAAHIGVSTDLAPRDAILRLVSYFRAFQPSGARPESHGANLYRDLAFSQIGVCRHRSYAFVVTALALGIPARMVRNEAHAWVEVHDGALWHRIDLGGAANRLDAPSDTEQPHHVLPTDPYSWPEGSESGQALAERHRGSTGGGSQAPGAASRAADGGAPLPSELGPTTKDERPSATLVLGVLAPKATLRGQPLAVRGSVQADGDPCAHARVDVAISRNGERPRRIGSLAANERGEFNGDVIIPLDANVGEHDVVVATPGDSRCGPGEAR